ncbi:hypothetical protein [Brevundimonas denitrificans]|uniref:hypothetical protein n=1 Tax=Brevundimonas denitrificans TaxID=1443434 RepID=UPI00223AE7DC|nr:hypothetical protein [Brevundimonas denitrificans]
MRRDQFSIDDMTRAMPGHAPHRAYVGQPQRYDVMGASQFALLSCSGCARPTACWISAAARCGWDVWRFPIWRPTAISAWIRRPT